MQDLIAFQLTLTGSAQNLTAWPVKNGITIINNSSADQVAVGNSSGVTISNGALINAAGTQSSLVWVPLSGGNTDQVWVDGTSGQTISVIGT